MKKFVLLLVVLFSLISCDENIKFNSPSVQGMKDNIFWRAIDSRATILPDGSLLIEAFTANEVLSLKTNSTKSQNYPLGISNSSTAIFTQTIGTEKITFKTDSGVIVTGQIVITKYDDVNKTISGSFKFNAKRTDTASSPDTFLWFQQGIFNKVPVSSSNP